VSSASPPDRIVFWSEALATPLTEDDVQTKPRQYPERKQRDLTDEVKSRLRSRIERRDAHIYSLATDFRCSASQVAGIKAAMHR
jgi:hypothetical protein